MPATKDKQSKLKDKPQDSHTKALLIFLLIIFGLLSVGLIYYFQNDQNFQSTESFFENRKGVQEYHEYKESEESAKKRAERNIFLQD